MKIGAHVSSAGGISQVFDRAAKIGAEAIQLFLSAPRRWKGPEPSVQEVSAFRALAEQTGLPTWAHAPYLVNLASGNPEIVEKSVGCLLQSLRVCNAVGIEGLVFHVGSHLGAGFEATLGGVAAAIGEVIAGAEGKSLLLLENNAGQGGGVGATFAELGAIIEAVDDSERLGVCLDTCHALAMGYDLSSSDGTVEAMSEFERELGLARLEVVHANDSKAPLGGVRDRHENIGDGHIGIEGFTAVIGHAAFAEATFLLEVPGLEGNGPDTENVRRLKDIRARVRPGG